jgi:hypothetical protein
MKYIKTYESFKDDSQVNEEFIGKIFKNLKNKLSLGFSKMFGSAQEVDKLMEQYKKEVTLAQQKKKVSLTTMGEYFKSIVNGSEKDPNKVKELKKNIELADKNYDNQIKIIKQKFDLKFDEIVKGEENEKIKNYIQLKKLEMQQELLQGEMESLLSGDMKSEDIDDPDFKSILSEMEKKTQETIKLTEEQKKELESKKEVVVGFDIDKAKQMASKGEVYTWEKSTKCAARKRDLQHTLIIPGMPIKYVYMHRGKYTEAKLNPAFIIHTTASCAFVVFPFESFIIYPTTLSIFFCSPDIVSNSLIIILVPCD